MSWVDFFRQRIKDFPNLFPREMQIKIIATPSIDSIVACSFLIKLFFSLSYNFSCSFYKRINDSALTGLSNDPAEILIFVNPNFSPINKLKSTTKKEIIVIQGSLNESSTEVKIISSSLINSEKPIPASSLTYILCKELYSGISELSYLLPLSYLSLDLQPPEELLNEAIISKKLEIRKGVTILSSQTVPIHKAIADTLCPYLPGISGSEDAAVNLLIENAIPIRENNRFRRVIDLTEDETKKLLTAILLKRLGSEKNPDLILGQTYIMPTEDDNSIIKDLKGFLFLLDSCISYSKYSLAVNLCLNPNNKSKALEFFNNAMASLVSSMEHYLSNKKTLTAESENIVILNMAAVLDYKFLSQFARIVINSNFLGKKIIAIMVQNPIGETICLLADSPPSIEQLLKNMLIKFDQDSTETNTIITLQPNLEEELIKNLLSSSENIK